MQGVDRAWHVADLRVGAAQREMGRRIIWPARDGSLEPRHRLLRLIGFHEGHADIEQRRVCEGLCDRKMGDDRGDRREAEADSR